MAQTQRTLSNLWTLLADNTTQQISPQDLRDALETMRPRYGQIYVAEGSGSPLTLTDNGTYYETSASTWTFEGGYEFDMPTNGRLRYIGAQPIMVHAAASVSFTGGTAATTYNIRIGKSGTPLAFSQAQRYCANTNDVGSTAIHAVTMLSTNDYLSLWFRSSSSTSSITLSVANLQLMSMPM